MSTKYCQSSVGILSYILTLSTYIFIESVMSRIDSGKQYFERNIFLFSYFDFINEIIRFRISVALKLFIFSTVFTPNN